MGFELPNGKTARNLQEQVKFLTEKLKELIKRVNDLELKIEIVDELPETGSTDVIYFVPAEDPETGNYYEEFMWIDDAWEQVGSTKIDLTNYVTTNTNQTITGEKTFSSGLKITDWTISQDPYSRIGLKINNVTNYFIGQNSFYTPSIFPKASNTYDLGSSTYAWKDLYLSGKVYISNNQNISLAGALPSTGAGIKTIGDNLLVGIYSNYYNQRDAGYYYTTTAFRPENNNALDLGASSYTWKDLYLSGSAKFSNEASNVVWEQLATNYGNLTIKRGNVAQLELGENAIFLKGIFPYSNGVFDIGTSGTRYRDLYISRNLSDGTNSVTVASLAALSGAHLYKHLIVGDTSHNIVIISNSNAPITTGAGIAAAFMDCVRMYYFNSNELTTHNVLSVGVDSIMYETGGSITQLSVDFDSIVDSVSAYN